jgi:hypothetical protein
VSAAEDVAEKLEARDRYVQLEPGAGEEEVEEAANHQGAEVDEDGGEEVTCEARSGDTMAMVGEEQANDAPGREGEEERHSSLLPKSKILMSIRLRAKRTVGRSATAWSRESREC